MRLEEWNDIAELAGFGILVMFLHLLDTNLSKALELVHLNESDLVLVICELQDVL